MVEVPRARLGLLPTAGVLTSLGTLRGLAVRAGVLNLGHALHGSCWKQIQPLWGLKGGWEAAGGRVFSPAERELRKTTHCPPALLSGLREGLRGEGTEAQVEKGQPLQDRLRGLIGRSWDGCH